MLSLETKDYKGRVATLHHLLIVKTDSLFKFASELLHVKLLYVDPGLAGVGRDNIYMEANPLFCSILGKEDKKNLTAYHYRKEDIFQHF